MNVDSLMYPECFHLLVAAGSDSLRQALVQSLAPAGYRLEEVRNEKEAIDMVRRRRFDLVLLGFDLPDTSGIDACRKLRGLEPRLRRVMIGGNDRPGCTSQSSDEQTALDAGADDCIAAPFRFREVVARLSAVLRHVRRKRGPRPSTLRAGCLEVDPARRLLWRAGREVHLSPREFDLLHFLMRNPEMAFTHVKLLRALRGAEG